MRAIGITKLPQNVQESVRSTLTAYDVAYIERENGKYTHCAGLYLDTRVRASDFTIFEIKKGDVYTPEEQAAHLAELNKPNADGGHWTDYL